MAAEQGAYRRLPTHEMPEIVEFTPRGGESMSEAIGRAMRDAKARKPELYEAWAKDVMAKHNDAIDMIQVDGVFMSIEDARASRDVR